ncbi:MAG TPA: aconitate hydratase AcnA, partial [Nitrososphaerales archaeon]|nr:aconitate hydratase AcnA [Nitrososphaerales archaeon]
PATSPGGRSLPVAGDSDPPPTGIQDGSVVISAITSCTNTSNPTVMVGAGLLAKNAVDAGLSVKPWVKTSLAPGSTVVTDYLQNSDLLRYLARLGFVVVGYGCTTCIGNSGPLSPEVEKAIRANDLYAVAVLSGNRNFDGRIHPLVKGSFLMSPMLVVAYALSGRIDFDFYGTPLGYGKGGKPVFLKDIWPGLAEIKTLVERSLSPDLYSMRYADAMTGDARWESLATYKDEVFHWDEGSTYVRRPHWLDPELKGSAKTDILGARALALLGDKVTTDHISPAGTIPVDSPAGTYLTGQGVEMIRFSSYGARRGNHEVMVRGGFSNIRLRNAMAGGREGGYTTHLPSKEVVSIYDAAMEYAKDRVPLIILAGKQYGMGSSRDWAAKAPKLLGVRAVIAEDFERIHRSNLVAMGVLPLQFKEGEDCKALGLTGEEAFDVLGVERMSKPRQWLDVVARKDGAEKRFTVLCRVDNWTEMQYVVKGGVLPYVFDKLLTSVH